MINHFALILTTALLLGITAASAQEGAEGEPEIIPEEIVAPSADWSDGWGGLPPPWFEDPASVDCHGLEACQDSFQNQTEE